MRPLLLPKYKVSLLYTIHTLYVITDKRKRLPTPGFEPGVKVLQTSALPLGYVAIE